MLLKKSSAATLPWRISTRCLKIYTKNRGVSGYFSAIVTASMPEMREFVKAALISLLERTHSVA
jgi:hypothetical protein